MFFGLPRSWRRPRRWQAQAATRRRGAQASRVPARRRGRSVRYHANCRSTRPMSSSRVLISTTIRSPVRASNARRSIQPRDRPWAISTSLAVCHSCARSRRSTYPEHWAWTASRCRGSSRIGGRMINSTSSPSAIASRSAVSSEGSTWPSSIFAIWLRDTCASCDRVSWLMPSRWRDSSNRRANDVRIDDRGGDGQDSPVY